LARFIEGGHLGAHIRTMRTVYAHRRDVLARLLRTHLADWLEPQVPAGGMQMACHLRGGLPEAQLVAAAARAGITLAGLSALYSGTPRHQGVLMGFAAHSPMELEAGVRRLAEVLRTLPRPA
jgi:GntR family transcriptional regulator/MocR family aminotransferase